MDAARRYPASFPTEQEELFLRLVLSDDASLPALWEAWRGSIVFDDIDRATLRLLPLLYLRLKNFDIHDDVTGRITGVYKMTWYQNQLLLRGADKAAAALNAAGIEPVALKGVSLLRAAYQDAGARFAGDIDLLIAPEEARRAADALLADGWRLSNDRRLQADASLLRRFADPMDRKFVREITFIGPRGVNLDLHTAIFNFDLASNQHHRMSYDTVKDRLQPLPLEGASCRMLCPEDLLIHVVAHGAPSSSERALRWVTDAAAVLERLPVDWDTALARIERFGLVLEMQVGLSYLAERMGLSIPKSFRRQLAQLPVDPAHAAAYYARAGGVRLVNTVGATPVLWLAYRRYERKGSLLTDPRDFLDYLCRAWGVDTKRQLPAYVAKKLRGHFGRVHPAPRVP